MQRKFQPEDPLSQRDLEAMSLDELGNIQAILVTSLIDVLAFIDGKEENIDKDLKELSDQIDVQSEDSVDTAENKLLSSLTEAQQIRDNKILVQREFDRKQAEFDRIQSEIARQQSPEYKINLLKVEFEQKLKDINIEGGIVQLNQVIANRQRDLERAISRNRARDQETAQSKLNEVLAIRAKYDEIQQLQLGEDQKERLQLQALIKDLRMELEIFEDDLSEDYLEKEKQRQQQIYERLRQLNAPISNLQKIQQRIKQIEELEALEVKLLGLIPDEEKIKSPEQIYKKILAKHEINDFEELKEEIQFLQESLQDQSGMTKSDIDEKTTKLADLNKALEQGKQFLTNIKTDDSKTEEEAKLSDILSNVSRDDGSQDGKSSASSQADFERRRNADIKKEEQLSQGIKNAICAQKMNQCYEKTSFLLNYYACLQKYSSPDRIFNSNNLSQKLAELLSKLQQQAQEEEIMDYNLTTLQSLEGPIDGNLDQIINSTSNIINFIRSFSFQELFNINSEIEKSKALFHKKHLILLYGTNCSGKTTLAHILGGSELEIKAGQFHYEASLITNPDLRNAIISKKSSSETRYPTPIRINHEGTEYVIVDTSGSQEDQIPVIDFCNQLGVNQSISLGYSARLFLLFSYNYIGLNMENLKLLILYYCRQFKDIQKNVVNFTYCFTHVPKQNKGKTCQLLKEVKAKMSPSEDLYSLVSIMLDDMIQKAEIQKIYEVNPTDKQFGNQLLKQLKEIKAVQPSSDFIIPNVSKSSTEAFKEQLQQHERKIFSSIKLHQVETLSFKLGELNKLMTILPNDIDLKQCYERCLQKVKDYVKEQYTISTLAILKQLDYKSELNLDHIENFQKDQQKMASFDQCINTFQIGPDIMLSASYPAFLAEKIAQKQNELIQAKTKISDMSWSNLIKKVDLICSKFKSIEEASTNFKNTYMDLISAHKEQCFSLINSENGKYLETFKSHDKLPQIIIEILKASENLSKVNTLLAQQVVSILQEINGQYEDFLTNLDEEVFKVFEKGDLRLTEKQVEDVIQAIDCLTKVKKAFDASKITNISKLLQNQIDSIKKVLENVMKTSIERINKQMTLEKPNVPLNFQQNVLLLKKIPLAQTSNIEMQLFDLTSLLNNFLSKQFEGIENLIAEYEEKDARDKSFFTKLGRYLEAIKAQEWIKNFEESVYEDNLQKIQDLVVGSIEDLQSKLKGKNYDLKDAENIKILARTQAEVSEYQIKFKILGIKIEIGNQMSEGIKAIVVTFKRNEQILNSMQEITKPLDVAQLQSLTSFNRYIQIIKDNQQLIQQQFQIEEMPDKISALFSKQNSLILEEIRQHSQLIFEACDFQKYQTLKHNLTTQLNAMQSLLKQINILRQIHPDIFKMIDPISNLISTIEQAISQIMVKFTELKEQYQDKNPQMFRHCYNVFKQITFLDEFNNKETFTRESAKWQSKILKNPGQTTELCKKHFQSSNWQAVNDLIKSAFMDASNKEEQENLIFLVQEEILKPLEELQQFVITEQSKIEEFKKVQNIKVSLDIYQKIQAKEKLNIDMKQLIDEIFNRLKEQAQAQLNKSKSFRQTKDYVSSAISIAVAKYTYDSVWSLPNRPENYQQLIQAINAEQSESILNLKQDVKEYRQKDLTQNKSPKMFFEELKTLQNYQDTQALCEELAANSIANLRNILFQINIKFNEQNLSSHQLSQEYAKFESLKELIPSTWADQLNIEISKVREDIIRKAELEARYKSIVQNTKSIDSLINLSNENPRLKEESYYIIQLKDCMTELLQKCHLSLLELDKLQEGIKQIVEIENFIPIISSQLDKPQIEELSKLKSEVMEIINKITDEFSSLFADQSHFAGIQQPQSKLTEEQTYAASISSLSRLIKALKNSKDLKDATDKSEVHKFIELLKKKAVQINLQAKKYFDKLIERVNKSISDNTFALDAVQYQNSILEMLRADNIIRKMREANNIIPEINLGALDEWHAEGKFLIDEQRDKIIKIKDYIEKQFESLQLINDTTKQSHRNRANHFKNIDKMINFIDTFIGFDEEVKRIATIDFSKAKLQFETQLNDKIDQIIYKAKSLSNDVGEQTVSQQNLFSEQFSHLKSISENLSFNQKLTKEAIKVIQDQFNASLSLIFKQIESNLTDINFFAKDLIKLQIIRENVTEFESTIKDKMSQLIRHFKDNHKRDTKQIMLLAIQLEDIKEGSNITAEFKEFQGVKIAMFNQQVQKIPVKTIISNLKGDNLDVQQLEEYYNRFKELYERIIQQSLKEGLAMKKVNLQPIIDQIQKDTNKQHCKWTRKESEQLPELLAYIFSLWTLSSADNYYEADQNDENKSNYLKQPHCAQVISIFRVMGIGYTTLNYNKKSKSEKFLSKVKSWFGSEGDKVIADNFVQIKTGEGKSVTLAVVSSIFALYGFEVRVACYSEYLSSRDFKSFEDLFKILNIQNSIDYGTFNQACESYINKDGKIRDIMLSKILKGREPVLKNKSVERPRVLMIDEVDVFFSKDFFGQQYVPLATIKHELIVQLLDYVWENRNSEDQLKLRLIKQTEIYKKCLGLFNLQFAQLLEEAVKNMITDVKNFLNHDYVEVNGRIGYKDQDQINFNISYGYQTTFAYYQKNIEGKVTFETLEEQKTIGIVCGCFSFAEIPKMYNIILGVTGTLEQLTEQEKKIVKDIYSINNFTFSPSVYGESNLTFDKQAHISITKIDDYYREIVTEINRKLTKNTRAVIVFFSNDSYLQLFIQSQEFKNQAFPSVQVLNEQLNQLEKEQCIKKASYQGQVTLATRSFGRGVDFICKDQIVEAAGGVHVLLTFFSHEVSEEVQLLGRTARQGNKGSVSMVLLIDELAAFNFFEESKTCGTSKYYETLAKQREHLQSQLQMGEQENLKDKKKNHKKAFEMLSKALEGDNKNDKEIFEFLKGMNLGNYTEDIGLVRTLIMMDATGSMFNLLNKTKNAVSTMFQEANKILVDQGYDPASFVIQFGCYRNYNSTKDNILMHSSWEQNPASLAKFMSTIESRDGYKGSEAVEIGLWHANQLADSPDGLNQVFIIGDAPPNSRKMVEYARDPKNSKTKWNETKFAVPTHYKEEIKKLKEKDVQVYTFYVDEQAKAAFEEIANDTGAKCQFLDVNSMDGQKMLIELFVTEILRKIGNVKGGEGKGEQLVIAYRAYKQSQ